ncbi:MAG: AAA family ATPase [Actinobacteria bacterium]|nr:AAA family ATPase [Actinomycetota bacterium]
MRPKVVVKGASGSGKTTVARELARRLSVPYVELDALCHGPDWAEASDEEFSARVEAATAGDGWVVDGNYERKIGDLVVERAGTIVWLDMPLRVDLARLWRRTTERIRDDIELWNGNRETWRNAVWTRDSLFAWTIRSHRKHRREWPERFRELERGGKRVVRLRSAEEAERWLAEQTPTGESER